MVDGDDGRDVDGEQPVDELVIVIERLVVDAASAIGQHAWPGDGEAIGVDAELTDDVDVFLPAVVTVVGDRVGGGMDPIRFRRRICSWECLQSAWRRWLRPRGSLSGKFADASWLGADMRALGLQRQRMRRTFRGSFGG